MCSRIEVLIWIDHELRRNAFERQLIYRHWRYLNCTYTICSQSFWSNQSILRLYLSQLDNLHVHCTICWSTSNRTSVLQQHALGPINVLVFLHKSQWAFFLETIWKPTRLDLLASCELVEEKKQWCASQFLTLVVHSDEGYCCNWGAQVQRKNAYKWEFQYNLLGYNGGIQSDN